MQNGLTVLLEPAPDRDSPLENDREDVLLETHVQH